MTSLTSRDFRNRMAFSFDQVDAGENVFIRRKNKLYTIIPVDDRASTITPSLATKIGAARREYKEGKALRFNTAAEAQKWMEEL